MATTPTPDYLVHLTETVAGTAPPGSPDEKRIMARATIEALKPRDVVEAMLVARMIAAHHATMDAYQRAMLPDTSNAESVRLRNNAVAAGRAFDAALRALEQGRAAPFQPQHPHEQPATANPPPRTAPAQSAQPSAAAVPVTQPRPHDTPRGNGQPGAISRAFAFAHGAANRQPAVPNTQQRA